MLCNISKWFLLLLAVSVLSCTKKEAAKTARAIPADIDMVAYIDGKPLVAFAKEFMTGIGKDQDNQMLTFDKLDEKAKELVGVSLNQIGKVTMMGYSGSVNMVAFIAEGVDPSSLKGEKRAEHNGIALYHMEKDIDYAPLKGLGVLAGSSEKMLKKVLDTYSGKAKNITNGDRSKILAKLSGFNTGLNQVRMYVLNPQIPKQAAMKIQLNGVGFFMHLDKGLAVVLLSDEEGATAMKSQIDQGIMAAKMMLTGDSAFGLPIKLDSDTKKLISTVIEKIKISQSGSTLSIQCRHSLKTLIRSVFSMGLDKIIPGLAPKNTESVKKQPSEKQ